MSQVLVAGSYNAGLSMRVGAFPRPGETVLGGPFVTGPGGKGANQAIGAKRLGADVLFVTKLGDDPFGRSAARLLEAEGLPASGLLPSASPTGVAMIMTDQEGENAIAVAPGANEELSVEDVLGLGSDVDDAEVVVVQLECSPDLAAGLCQWAKVNGKRTVLNPAPWRPLPEALWRAVDVATPNRAELAGIAKALGLASPDPLVAAKELHVRGVADVIVTLGADGVLWVGDHGVMAVPAYPAKAVDTTGAGDAFSAALVAALAAGEGMEQAIDLGCRAGAFCVEREGVIDGLARREDLERVARDRASQRAVRTGPD